MRMSHLAMEMGRRKCVYTRVKRTRVLFYWNRTAIYMTTGFPSQGQISGSSKSSPNTLKGRLLSSLYHLNKLSYFFLSLFHSYMRQSNPQAQCACIITAHYSIWLSLACKQACKQAWTTTAKVNESLHPKFIIFMFPRAPRILLNLLQKNPLEVWRCILLHGDPSKSQGWKTLHLVNGDGTPFQEHSLLPPWSD